MGNDYYISIPESSSEVHIRFLSGFNNIFRIVRTNVLEVEDLWKLIPKVEEIISDRIGLKEAEKIPSLQERVERLEEKVGI